MAKRWELIGWVVPALAVVASCEDARPEASGGAASIGPQPTTTTSDAGTSETGTSVDELDAGTNVASELVRSIEANAAAYDDVDRGDLDDLLTLALVRAESPGGRAAEAAACATRVLASGFGQTQVAALCRDDRFDAATCALRAVRTFDRDAAVSLCARGSVDAATCAEGVVALGLARAQAVVACADRGDANVVARVGAATSAGFGADQTAALCARRGRASTAECARRASSGLGFTRDEAVALCRGRGAVETATCAASAVASGFSRPQAVALCAGRGQASNASCASTLLRLGVARDQIVLTCLRPETTLVP